MTLKSITYHFSYDGSWQNVGEQRMREGLLRMVTDIHSKAVMRAPVKTGALVNSGRFSRTGPMTYTLTFGNSRVPYAALREEVNHLHPWTTHYLQNSVNEVSARAASYFNNIV